MMMNIPKPKPTVELEMKVLSCEGLDLVNNSKAATRRPFISVTRMPELEVYTSRLNTNGEDDGEGGALFRVPLDSSFFSDANSSLQLQLYTKRRIVGSSQLGWCVIPASDIALLPPSSVRYLSYRLRGRDGSRGPAIINLSLHFNPTATSSSSSSSSVFHHPNATAIGIPVKPGDVCE